MPPIASVSLTPMDEDDVLLFEQALLSEEGTGGFQWFGFTDPTQLRTRLAADAFLGADGGMLAVRLDGASVGRVEWFAQAWGRKATSACWTIAAGIDARHRGRGIGSQAQRLLVAYLFEHTRAERIQAYTDVDNLAERRALAKAGFEEEGIVRRGQWRSGQWHDLVLSSALRS